MRAKRTLNIKRMISKNTKTRECVECRKNYRVLGKGEICFFCDQHNWRKTDFGWAKGGSGK